MPIRTGENKVSEVQLEYLHDAKENLSSDVAVDALLTVFRDEEITSGIENMHPSWYDIFKANQKKLKKVTKKEEWLELKRLFGKTRLFDPEVSNIKPNSSRIAFLLGAGASKPSPSDIPTVKELLPDLLERARRLDRDDLRRLVDFCEKSKFNNIEDLLTAAQLAEFSSRNPIVFGLLEYLIYRKGEDRPEGLPYSRMQRAPRADLSGVAFLQDTLQVLFGLLSSRMLPAKPNAGHKAIADYVRRKNGSAIITTNYDCCMDLALGIEEKEFSYLIDFANRESHQKLSSTTSLIKLHGSLNWFYCGTCQQVHLIDIKKTVQDYLDDTSCYSVIAVCKDCGGQRRGLLVPPLAMKFDVAPPLNALIERAQEAFNKADVIISIGFSFAEADLYISRMLTKSMQLSKKVKLIIFDPDHNVIERVRRQLSLRISNFDIKRTMWVSGDCAKMLPQFLSGQLKTKTTAQQGKKISSPKKKHRRTQ